MQDLSILYLTFLKIGAVNFGGGYSMLPLLERELVDDRGWLTSEEIMDYFAIGQCTPGIISINVATFVGSKRAGIPGGIAASLGFLSLPILIILAIAIGLTNFADIPVVQHAFGGIRVCVCVLILQAVLKLWKKAIVDKRTLVLYLVILLLTVFSKQLPITIPTAAFVIAAGVFGLLSGGPAPKKTASPDETSGSAGSEASTEGKEGQA